MTITYSGNEVLKGRVIRGANRGKGLGFPTANLEIAEDVLPSSGIYAAWVRVENEREWRPGAVNVGINPTFGEKKKKLEVHLLEYNGDLYDRILEVVLVACIRTEKKFKSINRLIRRMTADCRKVKKLLYGAVFPNLP
jgi:riboflavin kinase/FMN adenylyltransferase